MASEKPLQDDIRETRIERQLGLREVARALDVAPSYLSDIEHGRRVPSEETLKKLARILGLDFEVLMAKAGRVGGDIEASLQRTPTLGVLMRRVSERNLSEKQLKDLIDSVSKLPKGRGK